MFPNVRAALARKAWTYADLANATDIKPGPLSNKLRGKTSLTREEMLLIREALKPESTLDDLFITDEQVDQEQR